MIFPPSNNSGWKIKNGNHQPVDYESNRQIDSWKRPHSPFCFFFPFLPLWPVYICQLAPPSPKKKWEKSSKPQPLQAFLYTGRYIHPHLRGSPSIAPNLPCHLPESSSSEIHPRKLTWNLKIPLEKGTFSTKHYIIFIHVGVWGRHVFPKRFTAFSAVFSYQHGTHMSLDHGGAIFTPFFWEVDVSNGCGSQVILRYEFSSGQRE